MYVKTTVGLILFHIIIGLLRIFLYILEFCVAALLELNLLVQIPDLQIEPRRAQKDVMLVEKEDTMLETATCNMLIM